MILPDRESGVSVVIGRSAALAGVQELQGNQLEISAPQEAVAEDQDNGRAHPD